MESKTAGQILKEKRVERGWTIDDAEQATRIKKRYIIALEDDDYDDIPGDFYVRAYIKQYSDRLGTDYSPLINYYETGELIGDKDESEPSFEGQLEYDNNIDNNTKVSDQDNNNPINNIRNHLPIILLSGTALLILIGVSAIVFFNRPKTSLPTVTSSSSSLVSKEESQKEEPKEEKKEEKPKEEVKTKLEASVEGSDMQVKATNAPNPLNIEISVSNGVESWISVTNSDQENGLVLNSSKNSVTAKLSDNAPNAVITLGVVQGVSIKVDGQELDMSKLADQMTGTVSLNINYKN
ncbi:hypothetical protein BG262_00975 [Floricoccus penangensis]|uniref:DUF4115 domain-containing protein n=1 Tax=Floricoccus penangensis TaxID=1859475 RepID=A0A9Q5JH06_9LACT|nr:helix-turn-helix domain-containing protein [Floricoccus penangensis]OFI47227.1 hypothetical protein BG262_00975 [Floricoccus penangensis]